MMLSSSQTTPRIKRYDRVPVRASFSVIERHINVLLFLRRFRYADIHQIARYDGGSKDKIRRLMRDLFNAGYVDRPRSQIANIFTHHYKPTTYAITAAGELMLAKRCNLPARQLSALDTSKHRTKETIDHAIETTELMLNLYLAGRDRGFQLVDHKDLASSFPLSTRKAKRPFALPVDLDGVRHHIIPDRLFAFIDAKGEHHYFAVEIDRGSMPVERSFDSASSYGAKLPLYLTAFHSGLHSTFWGFKRFRILTVTPSERRIETMIKSASSIKLDGSSEQSAKVPSGLFLFTTPERLRSASPLDTVWTDVKGRRVELSL